MATIIIPFFPIHEEEHPTEPAVIEHLVDATWIFSRCALWPQYNLSEEEIENSKDYIRKYLYASEDKKRAFTALCQRVVLTQKYLCKSADRFVPMPSVWFNLEYPFGFAGTLAWLHRVEERRKKVPGYLAHITALATGYYDYMIKPTNSRFARCKETLQTYHAHGLLDLFYSATAHLIHQRA